MYTGCFCFITSSQNFRREQNVYFFFLAFFCSLAFAAAISDASMAASSFLTPSGVLTNHAYND